MLGIYTFIFSFVFKAKWNTSGFENTEFGLLLFSGLILYSVFNECTNEAPGLLVVNHVYIKQLIFPTEILPWVSLLTALFSFATSGLLLAAFYSIVHGAPPITALWLPAILFPIALITLGVAWFLSSIGLFLRDTAQVVGVLTTALLFMSPIFYPSSMIPDPYRHYYFLNPFARLLDISKGLLFAGTPPDWHQLLYLTLGSWVVAWLGYVWFMKTKHAFADAL
jgi:lipopolysaccharide transport system permease protein